MSSTPSATANNTTATNNNGGPTIVGGGRICKKCDSNDIEVDRARGISYCTRCGNVLEESIIVSEVQIEETSGGGCNVVGQFVSSSDTRAIISINGLQNTFRVSKEITLQNGRRLINEMASQLRLNQHCMDTAFNFYKLAVQRGLTRGRKIRQVIAACLYLVCRTEGTPHLLLDLCDCVHDDACYISSLGKLAMKFAYLLCIKLPEIDPGLFIPRFAQKLDFGAKTQDVTLTALRLVQRMNRDWMAIGRRPSGLCGAALLVSARLHEFHLTLDDIVRVVKVGKTTLRKRMLEFEDTPSSNLTVDEFHTIDLEQEHDPPAYTRSRKFAKIKQIEEMVNIEEIEKEIIQLQESIETALSDLQKAPRGPLAKYAKLEREILGTNSDLTNIDLDEAEEFLSEEQINIIRSIVIETDDGSATKETTTTATTAAATTSSSGCEENQTETATTSSEAKTDSLDKWNNLKPTLRSLGLVRESIGGGDGDKKRRKDDDDEDEEDLDDEDDDEEDDEEDGISDFSDLGELDEESENDETSLEAIRKRRKKYMRLKRLKKKRKVELADDKDEEKKIDKVEEPVKSTEQEVVIEGGDSSQTDKSNETHNKSTIEKSSKTIETNNKQATNTTSLPESTELDLSGIDDSEIDSMILSKEEIKTKAKLWLTANKDWLKEQKMKEDQRKKEREEMGLNGNGDSNVGVVGGSLSANHGLNKPKKTRIRRPKNTTPVANPQEAIERMLQEKKLSSKINYDVLKNLNKDLKKT